MAKQEVTARSRKFQMWVRPNEQEDLDAIRAMLSPEDPDLVDEAAAFRFCLRYTRAGLEQKRKSRQ